MNIFDKITDFYNKELPFVVYRKPNTEIVSGFFMNDDTINYTDNFSESGFVFAPFNSDEKAILFPIEKAIILSEEINIVEILSKEKDFLVDETSKNFHIKLVEKAIDNINNNEFKKVVISRKEKIELTDFQLVDVYQELLQNYKNAFVYVWFHPKVGLWLGATPETLLQIESSFFKTMSLAGTQVYQQNTEKDTTFLENVTWKSKELEEQELVTYFIENQVKEISSDLKMNKTETVRAGNLLHLRTKVTGVLKEKSTLKELIRALHPTPAVCGLPRIKAKEFILKNENYNRSFYTGFLGEINIEDKNLQHKKSSLFVNLRCMEIQNTNAFIYVGGGITKDSIAKKEWKETVSKSETMKKVL